MGHRCLFPFPPFPPTRHHPPYPPLPPPACPFRPSSSVAMRGDATISSLAVSRAAASSSGQREAIAHTLPTGLGEHLLSNAAATLHVPYEGGFTLPYHDPYHPLDEGPSGGPRPHPVRRGPGRGHPSGPYTRTPDLFLTGASSKLRNRFDQDPHPQEHHLNFKDVAKRIQQHLDGTIPDDEKQDTDIDRKISAMLAHTQGLTQRHAAEIARFELMLEDARKHAGKQKQTIATREAHIAKLERELEDLGHRNEIYQTNLADMKRTNDTLEYDMTFLRAEIIRMRKALGDANKKQPRDRGALAAMQKAYEEKFLHMAYLLMCQGLEVKSLRADVATSEGSGRKMKERLDVQGRMAKTQAEAFDTVMIELASQTSDSQHQNVVVKHMDSALTANARDRSELGGQLRLVRSRLTEASTRANQLADQLALEQEARLSLADMLRDEKVKCQQMGQAETEAQHAREEAEQQRDFAESIYAAFATDLDEIFEAWPVVREDPRLPANLRLRMAKASSSSKETLLADFLAWRADRLGLPAARDAPEMTAPPYHVKDGSRPGSVSSVSAAAAVGAGPRPGTSDSVANTVCMSQASPVPVSTPVLTVTRRPRGISATSVFGRGAAQGPIAHLSSSSLRMERLAGLDGPKGGTWRADGRKDRVQSAGPLAMTTRVSGPSTPSGTPQSMPTPSGGMVRGGSARRMAPPRGAIPPDTTRRGGGTPLLGTRRPATTPALTSTGTGTGTGTDTSASTRTTKPALRAELGVTGEGATPTMPMARVAFSGEMETFQVVDLEQSRLNAEFAHPPLLLEEEEDHSDVD